MKKKGSVSKLPSLVQKGLREAMKSEKPLLLFPFNWAAKKIVGPKRVDDFYWKAIQKPILDVDTGLGRLGQKALGKNSKFFKDKKILPTKKSKGEYTGSEEVEIPSIMAPASKAGKVVLPLLGAVKIEEMANKMKEGNNMNQKVVTKSDLQKTAAMLTHLKDSNGQLKKEAKATELLYKQAEMGQISMPKTYAEFQEKVAELLSKDLNVVEEAIKMASSSEEVNSFGGLEGPATKVVTARDAFNMAITED